MTSNQKLQEALKAAVESRKSVAVTFSSIFLIFTLMILGSQPNYTWQILNTDILYFFTAMKTLTSLLYESSGALSVALTLVYSVVGGIAATNFAKQLKYQGGGIKNAGLLSPGLIVSGCAGCGAGILGLVGFAGALAMLPFKGNLVRLGGIGLLLFFLGKSGHPKRCDLGQQKNA